MRATPQLTRVIHSKKKRQANKTNQANKGKRWLVSSSGNRYTKPVVYRKTINR